MRNDFKKYFCARFFAHRGLFMKRITKLMALVTLVGAIFSVSLKNSENIGAQAAYGDTNVTVYLDKTTVIAGLGWWQIDDTYIHIWTKETGDIYTKMNKVSNTLFSISISATTWNSFDGTEGFRFYVYDRTKAQNQTEWLNGLDMKNAENNLFITTSANGGANQTLDKKNKEVEDTISSILALTCESDSTAVQAVVSQYQSLRAQGKTNLNTREVDAGVTWYERLEMYADSVGVPISPAQNHINADSQKNTFAIVVIALFGISSIVGYSFLKNKKIV